jgi:hypothetical protein
VLFSVITGSVPFKYDRPGGGRCLSGVAVTSAAAAAPAATLRQFEIDRIPFGDAGLQAFARRRFVGPVVRIETLRALAQPVPFFGGP